MPWEKCQQLPSCSFLKEKVLWVLAELAVEFKTGSLNSWRHTRIRVEFILIILSRRCDADFLSLIEKNTVIKSLFEKCLRFTFDICVHLAAVISERLYKFSFPLLIILRGLDVGFKGGNTSDDLVFVLRLHLGLCLCLLLVKLYLLLLSKLLQEEKACFYG